MSLGNLGLLLWNQGRHAEAEPALRRALTIDEAAVGPDHPYVASDLYNLANALRSALPAFDLSRLRVAGVLTRIAVVYFCASLLVGHMVRTLDS